MLSKSRSLNQCLTFSAAVCLTLFLSLVFFAPLQGGDIWWHLKLGQWITQQKEVPQTDPFAFTQNEIPWIYTQWLGGVLFYQIHEWGGAQALKIFLALAFSAIVAVFFFYARRNVPISLLFLLIFLMIYGLSTRLILRPLIFNFLFIQLFLIHLYAFERHGRTRSLIPLPFLGMVWGNLHLGSFLYGLLLVGIFFFSAVIQKFKTIRASAETREAGHLNKNILALGLLLLIYPLSFVVSPYGIGGLIYPFKVFLLPHFINFYQFNDLITEMQPPVYLFSWCGLWFLILTALTLGAIFLVRKKSFTDLLLFITALFMYLHSQRASAFFTIISVYIIAHSLSQGSFDPSPRLKRYGTLSSPLILVGLCVLLPILTWKLGRAHVILNGKDVNRIYLPLEPSTNPIDSVDLIKKIGLQGNIFCPDGLGGYLLWSGYPELKPFVDGRQSHQILFKQYLDVLRDPDQFWPLAQAKYKFVAVILDSSHIPCHSLIQYLTDSSAWQILNIDGNNLTFVPTRSFKAAMLSGQMEQIPPIPGPAGPEDMEHLHRLVAQLPTLGLWHDFLDPPPYYIDQLEEGIALYGIGFKRAGIQRILAVASSNPSPGIRKVMTAIIQHETNNTLSFGGKH